MGLYNCESWVQEPGWAKLFPFLHSTGQNTGKVASRLGLQTCGLCNRKEGNSIFLTSSYCYLEILHSHLSLTIRPTLLSPTATAPRASGTAVPILDFLLSCNLSRPQTMANVLFTHWEPWHRTGGLWSPEHALIICFFILLSLTDMVVI